uniref:Uncharacterized protein n=2 Tax=Oryza TaxID=4527 RepID=Q5VPA5_ORYSJ|nr:hypothetical protein [Oryza sativa Japonica Group]BAD68720.1 hypothetical protein [Oryza sativa Japonica Group]
MVPSPSILTDAGGSPELGSGVKVAEDGGGDGAVHGEEDKAITAGEAEGAGGRPKGGARWRRRMVAAVEEVAPEASGWIHAAVEEGEEEETGDLGIGKRRERRVRSCIATPPAWLGR